MMNEVIDRRFERVEKALVTLISSISTYNPSPTLANDLVAADAELSLGLEQLSTHQSNHAKILSLRATSVDLDAQIRENLITLTNTRAALSATPASSFPTDTNPVSYSELLDYARLISKNTLPPSFREGEGESVTDTGEAAGTNTPKEPSSQTQSNGTSTPLAANGMNNNTQAIIGTPMDIDSAAPAAGPEPRSQISLPIEIDNHLNPPPETIFIPWPTEDTIRRGALASIEILINQGIDPATFDPEKSAELEAERKRIQEEEEQLKEEMQARLREEQRLLRESRMSAVGNAVPRQEQASAFQLETFDDDDED